MKKVLIVIPARFDSTRLPGKPLLKIGGEELILRMCRIAESTGCDFLVATNDVRVRDCVESNGYRCIVSNEKFLSGTDRVAAIMEKIETNGGEKYDFYINLQCDEPFLRGEDINLLIKKMEGDTSIWTMITPWPNELSLKKLVSFDIVKVEVDKYGKALTFSRNIVPYNYGTTIENLCNYNVHIGIYGFSRNCLNKIRGIKNEKCWLEEAEKLEQLKWLYHGFSIKTIMLDRFPGSINIPDDLKGL